MEYIFITVNYNNANETIKYINSINALRYDSEKIRIIVVDNCSSSGDYNKLEDFISKYPSSNIKLKLVRSNKNKGYFSGLNIGLEMVKNITRKTCIIGNNDVLFEENFIHNYEKIEIYPDVIVVCPDIIDKESKHENPQLENRASFILKAAFKIYFTHYLLSLLVFNISKTMKKIGLRKPNTSFEVGKYIYQGSGACYILPSKFFEYYQSLDDRVFLWGEERLLANQVLSAGCKKWYAPSLKVYHNENMSTSKVPSREAWVINSAVTQAVIQNVGMSSHKQTDVRSNI
ncbi:MAG: glycosyltransferase [Gammaproteobacteria bacterium]